MILEDVIMLARTVPEPSKKYGVRVCSVAYSPELRKLIRIYPLMPYERLKQRYVYRFQLERNDKDSRDESFKKITYTSTGRAVSKEELEPIFEKLMTDDLTILNKKKVSLGILKAEAGTYFLGMKSKKDIQDQNQLCLFEAPDLNDHKLKTGQDYQHIPYVTIPSMQSQKNIQLREWGIYKLLDKNDGCISDVYLSGIFNDNEVYFIVGNMNGCRSIWIVCSYYTYKPIRQRNLFDE